MQQAVVMEVARAVVLAEMVDLVVVELRLVLEVQQQIIQDQHNKDILAELDLLELLLMVAAVVADLVE
jgi:hypothetical protein